MRAAPGYTLIELLVVIGIIGLVIALAAPVSMKALDGARLAADARSLASTLRALKDAPRAARADVTVADGRVTLSGKVVALPNASRAALIGADQTIAVYGDGTTTGGRIRLSLEDRRTDVVVAWLTGSISIEAAP